MESISVSEFLGKSTLIIGDVGVGKTKLTALVVEELLKKGYGNDITIIDLAPMPVTYRGMQVGGRVSNYVDIDPVRYLTSESITAPRLTAKSRDELVDIIERNRQLAESCLEKYLVSPTKILTINDLTIYLHAGRLDIVTGCISKSETFIGNAYYGDSLKNDLGTGISTREKQSIDRFCQIVDRVISL